MDPRAFIMNNADGWFLCKPSPITNAEETLRHYFGQARRLMRSAFLLDETPVDVAIGNDALCGVRLKELTLCTKFRHVGEHLVPVFGGDGIRLTLTWNVPDGMDLRFASRAEFNGMWKDYQSFLFLRRTGVPGFMKLPLPNIYSHGEVCMGDRVRQDGIRGNTLQDCFKASLESFRQTTWNSELLEHTNSAQALFRWTVDRKPLPAPAEWWRYCQACSRQEMEDLCPV